MTRKQSLYLLGEREAECEVAVDILCARHGDKDQALLQVAAHTFGEYKVSTCEDFRKSLLHVGCL